MKPLLLSIILSGLFFPLAALAAADANLSVPFVPEAPDNKMVGPWKNACEEASVVMVEEYYRGNTERKLPKETAKARMTVFFNIENRVFGSNANTDAAQTVKLMNEYSPYAEAKIVKNPTLEQIKNELSAGRPIIALVNGRALNNPRILFLSGGSYYHTLVLKGFDDKTNEFITNDVGDYDKGIDLRYKYDIIMGALHDYNAKTKKTDGAPTVLFTSQRMLVKIKNSPKIYLIKDNEKHYVSSPRIFKNRGWKWSWVQTVEKSWLDKFKTGPTI